VLFPRAKEPLLVPFFKNDKPAPHAPVCSTVLSLQVKRYPVKTTHHSSFLSVLLEEFPSVVEKMSSDLLTYAAIAIALEKKQ
jgi:hypothetical protein